MDYGPEIQVPAQIHIQMVWLLVFPVASVLLVMCIFAIWDESVSSEKRIKSYLQKFFLFAWSETKVLYFRFIFFLDFEFLA